MLVRLGWIELVPEIRRRKVKSILVRLGVSVLESDSRE